MLQLIETSGQSTRNVYKGDTLGYHKVIDFVMNPQTQSLKAVILKAELPGHDPQTLESGKEIVFTDRSVSFHNKVDNTTTPMMRVGDHYEFRDEKFSLKAIDTANRKVIIQDAAGKEYTLPMPK
jgi:hypothetical protein